MLKITLSLLMYCTLFTGVLKAQVIKKHTPNNTPDIRYTLHSDGTVTDTAIGLQWQRCSLGQNWDGSTCTGSASKYTWHQALQQADSNRFAGYSDWRVPNRKELLSIVVYNRYRSAINHNVFPNTPSRGYWLSLINENYSDNAWIVNFNNGYDYNNDRDNNNVLRLVRGGSRQ